eukprot:UN00191
MAQQPPQKYQAEWTSAMSVPAKRAYGCSTTYGKLTEKVNGVNTLKDKICYGTGLLAVIRDVENTNNVTLFNGHQAKVNVVVPAPNGNWVASGDDSGVVHIFSYPFLTIKNTLRIGSSVADIKWTQDSAMVVAAGNGTTEFAKAFRFDSQNPLGKLDRMTKSVLSVDWSPIKPYRIALSTEDCEVLFYHGVPFKYDSRSQHHTRYPNVVRFAPDGKHFITVGSDFKVIVYDGQTGAKVREIVDEANGHKGSIFGLAWKADSTEFVTASADKTIKVWNFEEGKVVHTWTSNLQRGEFDDQQACVMWGAAAEPISVSISGAVEFWSRASETPVKVIYTHHSAIASKVYSRVNKTLYTGDLEGTLLATDVETGEQQPFFGAGHANGINALAVTPNGETLYSAGYDNTVQKSDAKGRKFGGVATVLPSNAKAMVANDEVVIIALSNGELRTYAQGAMGEAAQVEKFAADRLTLNGDKLYAISNANKLFRVYTVAATGLTLDKTVNAEYSTPGDVAVAPNGQVFSSEGMQIVPWKQDFSGQAAFGWEYHNGPITALSVSPSGKYLVSVGSDKVLTVWKDMETLKGARNLVIRDIHPTGYTFVDWVDDSTVVTISTDSVVKKLKLTIE